MKIAYIVPSLVAKGPVIVVKELAEQMILNGHTCTVLYFDDKEGMDFPCPTFRISQKQAIDFKQYDIVHSHGLRPDRFVYSFREYSGKVHYISTIHNYVMEDFRHQYNLLIACVFGRLWMHWLTKHDKIVTLSMDAMRYYERWFSKDKLTYVYNTRNPDKTKKLSDDEWKELSEFKGKSRLIGVNALLSPRKGIDILIKALPHLPGYKLFVVGDGKTRKQLEQLARNTGVGERCYFAGIRADAYRYLPHYDIFAMPSRSEGFPLALLEASVYSKPSVVSDIPIVTEAFTSDEVSVFRLSKPESIVEAVLKIVRKPDMGERMHQKYQNCYSPDSMYQHYISVYQKSNHR